MLDREDKADERVERESFEPLGFLGDRVGRVARGPIAQRDIDERALARERVVTRLAVPRELRVDDLLGHGRAVAHLVPALLARLANDKLQRSGQNVRTEY